MIQGAEREKTNLERMIVPIFAGLKTKGARLDLSHVDTRCPGGDNVVNEHISLRAVSMNMPDIEKFILQATTWRNAQSGGFFSEFIATEQRTRSWLQTAVEENPTRTLFLVEMLHKNQQAIVFGHLGLRYDSAEDTFEVENILRGVSVGRGCFTTALSALCTWTFRTFPVKYVFLRSFGDNFPALALYERCGFKEAARWFVFQQKSDGEIIWRPTSPPLGDVPRRVVVCMRKYRHG